MTAPLGLGVATASYQVEGAADADGRAAAIVYLYKRGTFYPFVQTGPHRRDNAEEFNIKAAIGADLRFEEDTSKWSPLWDAPGMLD